MFVINAIYITFTKINHSYHLLHIMSQKILIIDDDHDVLLTARMFLEQLDFDVTVLSDPGKILAKNRQGPF